MDNENHDTQDNLVESEHSPLAKISDWIVDLFTGTSIPKSVRRNASKAFGQLCTATMKVPTAYFEGWANEIEAGTQARVKIIETSGTQIAEQMNVPPEYAQAAIEKYAQKILRKQVNIDKTCQIAAEQIQADVKQIETSKSDTNEKEITEEEVSEENTISDDWINAFENEAASKSTEEMQSLFGRILAGEILKPKSFSIKTLKLIGELDSEVAKLFQLLCSLATTLEKPPGEVYIARVLSLNGNAASNSLLEYGLGFANLNILEEYGLIISDYNSYSTYNDCIAVEGKVNAVLGFQNKKWGLIKPSDAQIDLKLHGVALTNSGKELMKIVDIEPNPRYMLGLLQYFQSLGLQMVEIT